jgi:hypothetical protein
VFATPDWPGVVASLTEKFVADPLTGEPSHQAANWVPHEVPLLQSNFSEVETMGRVFARTLSVDDIVGRVFSMSVTSPEVLGSHRGAFEAALRSQLADLAAGRPMSEMVEVEAMLAFRPIVE